MNRLILIVAIGLVGLVVLVGLFFLKDSSSPPIPVVPGEMQSKSESAVFMIVAKFESAETTKTLEYGSCFAIGSDGTFVTCAHVVTPPTKGSQRLSVNLLINGEEIPAEVILVDEETDTAVLHVGDYEGGGLSLTERQPVSEDNGFVFGYPTKYSGMAIPHLLGTGAIIEDIDHKYIIAGRENKVIKVRGTSNFGGSGGPVLNNDGQVIGMAFASRFTDENSQLTSHVFAIPASVLERQILRSREERERSTDTEQSNLDGDEFVDLKDSTPYVADYPTVEILVTDFRLGLKPEITRMESQTDLSVGDTELRHTSREQRELYEGMTTRSSVSSTQYSGGFSASGTVSVGTPSPSAGAISLRYGGTHRESTQERIQTHRTETTISSERMAKVTQRLKLLKQKTNDVVFSPESGYLELTVNVRNTGHVPCPLVDFSVNVQVGESLRYTLSSATNGDFKPKNLSPWQSNSESFVVKFNGLNTHDVEEILNNNQSMRISFEILPSSIELGVKDSLQQLGAISEKCAVVEIEYGNQHQRTYISAMGDEKSPGVSLEELIRRVPDNDTPVEWSIGPFGDSLVEFFGKKGRPFLLPDNRTRGQWLAFHNGEELTGKWRTRNIQPSDILSLRYMTPSEYWGNPEGWKGLVKAYADLRTLADTERRFWTEVYSFNRPGKGEWGVQAKNSLREQAREMVERYEDYFGSATLPSAIRHRWPNAILDTARFSTWFAGNEIQFPKYIVKLERVDAWWNIDEKLSPQFELIVGNKPIIEVDSDAFNYDRSERSGSSMVTKNEFTWSPFQEVEFRLSDNGIAKDTTLLHIRSQDFQSLESFLDEIQFKPNAFENLDPATSGAQLMFHLNHNGLSIRQDEFTSYFTSNLPRVVGIVPSELTPDLLAFDFWVDHRPVAYAHSAVVFEELYNSNQGKIDKLESLSRAIIARFRCFDFRRCVELAEELPSIGEDENKRVIPGMTLADVRELALVADDLAKQDATSPSFMAFARVLLHWQSHLRLKYLVNHEKLHREIGDEGITEWTSRLKVQLTDDTKFLDQIKNDSIRSLAVKLIDDAQKWLEETALITP